ncbi:MAG: C45 family peptidase [Rhodospirillales bacterium]
MLNLTFEAMRENRPGRTWQTAFRRHWPGWKAWYLSHRDHDAPSLAESERALARYMPEFVSTWQRLADLARGDEEAARFLTFWCPPAYLSHCSQAVLLDEEGPVLVRNYDLDPRLNEATMLHSAWKGRRVIGSMEAIAGLADGVNDRGLALSLTFGGRRVVGRGFGIPLILRYILEVCEDTGEAIEVLRHTPSHMAYNVTLLDRQGNHATVLVAPDRPTIVTRDLAVTNHQLRVEWPEQAKFSRTAERKRYLDHLLAQPGLTPADLEEAFLMPPLFSRNYARGFGTVYTAAYRPLEGSVTLRWPDQAPWRQSFREFTEGHRRVCYKGHATDGAADAARRLREQFEALSAEEFRYLPAGFAEALLQGIKGGRAEDWQRFARLWNPGCCG